MQYQKYNKKIGFQGSEGANSHLAAKENFPNASLKSFETFEDLFAAVETQKVNLAIIPIENSHSGRVSEIHNLLKETNLHIVGEFFLDIKHHLAVIKGTKLEEVKEVYSHPQALMQSNASLKKLNLKINSYLNTALAAKFIKKQNKKHLAALCTNLAAEINGLEIIKHDLQESKNNKTTFVAIAKDIEELPSKTKDKITTLLFTARNIPASIYKCLGGFATNNINIIKLESYIPGGLSNEAQFYISFEGDTDDIKVKYALEELGFYTKSIKLLGVYDADPSRKKK